MSGSEGAQVAGRTAHRAWIEVDHAAIASNLATLRRLARPGQQVIGVVKANAYGHGDAAVAQTLADQGIERLAVATLEEGLRLRDAGIRVPILVLFAMTDREAPRALAAGLEATVFDARGVEAIASAARSNGAPAAVHIKVDTGLGRQGADPSQVVAVALDAARRPGIEIIGTYTHLAAPGEDDAYSDLQLVRFARALDWMRSSGIDPGLVHAAGTGGLLAGVASFADAIRPGLGLYGMAPAWASAADVGLLPALALRALPLRVFEVPAGEPVGYSLRFRAERPSRIATLPIGYADGWPRVHANNGTVLVRGRRAPIVGAISMDAITVDVTEVDGVSLDDDFVVIGRQGDETITADEVAVQRRTINYEVTTTLGARLARIAVAPEPLVAGVGGRSAAQGPPPGGSHGGP